MKPRQPGIRQGANSDRNNLEDRRAASCVSPPHGNRRGDTFFKRRHLNEQYLYELSQVPVHL